MKDNAVLAVAVVGFDKFFAVWEKTGIGHSFRELVEIIITRVAAWILNRRGRKRAARKAARGYPDLHRRFEKATGYPLNLANPQTYHAKIQWRKVYDRNPLFPILADKQKAKGWIRDQLGEELTVPTLFQVHSPRDLPADITERELVLKVTHAWGRNIFVSPESNLTRGAILRRISRFLYRDFGINLHEWAYSEIDRSIIAEPTLRDRAGEIPGDARFHVFGGKLRYIFYNTSVLDPETNKTKPARKIHIGPDWTLLPVTRKRDIPCALPPRPRAFDRMVEIAETLAADFDHMRVDFFLLDDSFYISEMTFYPASGFKVFDPIEFDYELGGHWILPEKCLTGE